MLSTDRPILVVDDDADMRDALHDALEMEGYGVAEATDGLDALNYVRAHPPPALILLDWNMAPMNGPRFMEEYAKEPTFGQAPVVILTADSNAAKRAANGAFADCLHKPIELATLFAVIARVISGSSP
jgi:two-component system, chemotaxis family, chemotaxis protein CheY